MKKQLIVSVDDDPAVIRVLCDMLDGKGYESKGFSNSQDLFMFLKKRVPDLIILDVVMVGESGFDICLKLRQKKEFSQVPVIMLTGRSDSEDKVWGLDIGADDYIVKPFNIEEVFARIKAVLRRRRPEEASKIIKAAMGLELDLSRYQATVEGKPVDLTATEFRILKLLSSRKEQVFTRERILEYLWGEEKLIQGRTVDVHITHLREKLGKAGELIKNVRGIGYKLSEETE